MSWTPCGTDLNTTVCFDAVDRHVNFPTGVVLGSKASEMLCVKLQVLPDPAPEIVLTPSENLMLTMGRTAMLKAVAFDVNCQDNVTIGVHYGELMPISERTERTSSLACVERTHTMEFKPSLKLGGYRNEICVTATDTGGSCFGAVPHRVQKCISVTVARCVYALQVEQQLQELAGELGIDWMRLWSLNSALLHPDNLVYSGQEINIGHKYKVRPPFSFFPCCYHCPVLRSPSSACPFVHPTLLVRACVRVHACACVCLIDQETHLCSLKFVWTLQGASNVRVQDATILMGT